MGGVAVPRWVRREYWLARREGLDHGQVCERLGVSVDAGWRWVREAGGVTPSLAEPTGRYLSLAEREELSRGLARGLTQAQIARELRRDRATISRACQVDCVS